MTPRSFVMSDPVSEVLAFFQEWKPMMADMLASMEKRFTDATIWENVGLSRTTGYAEAEAFMLSFAQSVPIIWGEVSVHHIAAAGNVVLTERTDTFYDRENNSVLSIPLMGVLEMDGHKIVAWRDYFDTAKGFGSLPPGPFICSLR
jgi:limonene-1,2-epoxide hydrolase